MKLKSIIVKAKTVGEACSDVENGAGEKELQYVLDHPDEFPDMKDGKLYYFPVAGDGVRVPFVYGFVGRFWRGSNPRGNGWLSNDRVVVRDLALPIDSDLELDFEHLLPPKIWKPVWDAMQEEIDIVKIRDNPWLHEYTLKILKFATQHEDVCIHVSDECDSKGIKKSGAIKTP